MIARTAAAFAAALFATIALSPAHAGSAVIVGPNGGSGSATVNCHNGYWRDACAHSWDHTTANGKVWSGSGATVVGPYRARHVGTVTTPKGNTWHRNRIWR